MFILERNSMQMEKQLNGLIFLDGRLEGNRD
jgi:hypothetical protein